MVEEHNWVMQMNKDPFGTSLCWLLSMSSSDTVSQAQKSQWASDDSSWYYIIRILNRNS